MRHLYGDDGRDLSGFGDVAEVHEAADGNLYEWVEGLSAWGEPVGFWQGLTEVGVDTRAPEALGLGALYQASDGSLYQIRGLDEEAEKEGADEQADAKEADGDADGDPQKKLKMGPGRPGEIRVGPDGKRYRWVLGVGPGGKRTGFWRRLRPRPARARPGGAPGPRPGPRAGSGPRAAPGRPGAGGRKRKPLLKRLLPFAKVAASLIPIPGAGQIVKGALNVADKAFTRKPAVAGLEGLGALYQASDGSLYQLKDFAEDELRGVDADDLDGLAADRDLDGFAAQDFEGVDDGPDMQGWADAPDPRIDGNDPLDGYVKDAPCCGLHAYVPDKPADTRMFDATREPPALWKPTW
jgi:hypothetical protein